MTATLSVLQQFYREKLAQTLRHEAGARLIGQYDANNTYQYIVNRDEVQLSWLAAAIADLGGVVEEGPAPEQGVSGRRGPDLAHAILEKDSREAAEFVQRWRPRVEAMTHARHRGMLGVILGETLEQKRFFDQALAGRTDLLGRREASLMPSHGEVLPARWIE